MVSQRDIILMDFDPQLGHEQAGRRPAVVISNDFAIKTGNLILVCPITGKDKGYPLHVPISGNAGIRTKGVIECDRVRSVDLMRRGYRVVEALPQDIFSEVFDIVYSMIEPQ
jgi:mRNA interferase MazF